MTDPTAPDITEQSPIGTAFGRDSTTAEVLAGIDLTGKTALVTGGYSGLGLEVTRALVGSGARVIVPARRPSEASQALSAFGGDVTIVGMDLADLASVAQAGKRIVDIGQPIDIAILAAGIMATPETRVGDGWEAQFTVNHLGHFALIQRLWPLFVSGSRIVAVSSGAHAITGIRWDDMHFEEGYDKWQAYGQSKCANVLFALELDRRGKARGIRAVSAHPGSILTPLQRHLGKEEMVAAGWIDEDGTLIDPEFKTPEQGAATFVWAATSPDLTERGGVYCEDCDVALVQGEGVDGGVAPHALNPDQARRLWKDSEEMTGLKVIA